MAELISVFQEQCAGMVPLNDEDRQIVRTAIGAIPAEGKRTRKTQISSDLNPSIDFQRDVISDEDPAVKTVHVQHFSDGSCRPVCDHLVNDRYCRATVEYLPDAEEREKRGEETWVRSSVFAVCGWVLEAKK